MKSAPSLEDDTASESHVDQSRRGATRIRVAVARGSATRYQHFSPSNLTI